MIEAWEQRDDHGPAYGDGSRTVESRAITPLHGNVIVEREVREVTDGGIVIPEVARDFKEASAQNEVMRVTRVKEWDPRFGLARVVAVGPGRLLEGGRRAEPVCRAGDRVVLEKWEGLEFQLDGRDLLLMDEGGVLGVVEEE